MEKLQQIQERSRALERPLCCTCGNVTYTGQEWIPLMVKTMNKLLEIGGVRAVCPTCSAATEQAAARQSA